MLILRMATESHTIVKLLKVVKNHLIKFVLKQLMPGYLK